MLRCEDAVLSSRKQQLCQMPCANSLLLRCLAGSLQWVPLSVLLERASPLDRLCVCEVQVAFDAGLETTGPPDHVHEATFVAIYVGHTKGVDGAMLERRKGHAQCRVEDCIESP